jgi:hypothetical protein
MDPLLRDGLEEKAAKANTRFGIYFEIKKLGVGLHHLVAYHNIEGASGQSVGFRCGGCFPISVVLSQNAGPDENMLQYFQPSAVSSLVDAAKTHWIFNVTADMEQPRLTIFMPGESNWGSTANHADGECDAFECGVCENCETNEGSPHQVINGLELSILDHVQPATCAADPVTLISLQYVGEPGATSSCGSAPPASPVCLTVAFPLLDEPDAVAAAADGYNGTHAYVTVFDLRWLPIPTTCLQHSAKQTWARGPNARVSHRGPNARASHRGHQGLGVRPISQRWPPQGCESEISPFVCLFVIS